MTQLYHREIGFPAWFKAPTATVTPNYGTHARKEAFEDRYGHIALPATMDLSKYTVIEMEADGAKVVKILFRGALDARRDICVAMMANGFVKTVWVNLRTDTHRTLDRSKYVKP